MVQQVKKKQHKHDGVFKSVMQDLDVARALLTVFIGASALQSVDLDSLAHYPSEMVTKDLNAMFADVVIKASFVNKPGCLLFVFEHKSHMDRRAVEQLHLYALQLRKQALDSGEVECDVCPIFVYHGARRYRGPIKLVDALPQDSMLRLSLENGPHFIDLARVPDEQLSQHAVLAVAALPLKYSGSHEIMDKIYELIPIIERLLVTHRNLVQGVLNYAWGFVESDEDFGQLREVLSGLSFDKGLLEGGDIMGCVEYFKQKCEARGREEGRQEGIAEGHQQAAKKYEAELVQLRQELARSSNAANKPQLIETD